MSSAYSLTDDQRRALKTVADTLAVAGTVFPDGTAWNKCFRQVETILCGELEKALERASLRERESVWADMPRERRQALVLDVLGDERLTIREIWVLVEERLQSAYEVEGPRIVYQSYVGSVVKRMLREGQLERHAEVYRNKPRYRYARKRGLEGPIADLERAYHHDDSKG